MNKPNPASNPRRTPGSTQPVDSGALVPTAADAAARGSAGDTDATRCSAALAPPRATGGAETGRLAPPRTLFGDSAGLSTAARGSRAGAMTALARDGGGDAGAGAGAGATGAFCLEDFRGVGAGTGGNGPVNVTVCPSASGGGTASPGEITTVTVSGGSAAKTACGLRQRNAPLTTTATRAGVCISP